MSNRDRRSQLSAAPSTADSRSDTGRGMPQLQDIQDFLGQDVVDRDGQAVGAVDEMYVDDQTGEPIWGLVTAPSCSRPKLVPLRGATPDGHLLRVACRLEQVHRAPDVGGVGTLLPSDEDELRRHYAYDAPAPQQARAERALRGSTPFGAAHARPVTVTFRGRKEEAMVYPAIGVVLLIIVVILLLRVL